MLNPDNNSTYGGRLIKDLEEFKIIDDYTIQFVTKRPMANFLNRAVTDFQFLEPGYIEEVGIEEAAKKPIGTGPYKLSEWRAGESITLIANKDYWKMGRQLKKLRLNSFQNSVHVFLLY
ncbi:hypothetical protein CSV79_13285 [Sporosarcina sp. P13]|nr:ABC transporter substrate-binding protein [Sporosarcina sp. P13]PIC63122.1 hypothetical protein CSV79_13285 [Sporosarcina sp. P13]